MNDYAVKALQGTKALQVLPAWIDAIGANKDVVPQTEYEKVSLVFRAASIRAATLAMVPVKIYRNGKELDRWPLKRSLKRLLVETEYSLTLNGGAYWLKNRKGRNVTNVTWLNPWSMKVEAVGRSENEIILKFEQHVGGKDFGPWASEDMVYFREFSPSDDVGPGVCPADVALGSAQLFDYINRFKTGFFKHGAMPAVIIGASEYASDDDKRQMERFFNRMIVGVRNAWRLLVLRGKTEATILTPPIDSLKMTEILADARRDVAWAFGIPQTVLEDAANYATALAHDAQYWQMTVVPRTWLYEEVINDQLFGDSGYSVEFAPDEMDVFQEDENQRAQSLNTLTLAGIPLDIALEVLGYDLEDEQWARIKQLVAEKDKAASQARARLGLVGGAGTSGGTDGTSGSEGTSGGQFGRAKAMLDLERWHRKSSRVVGKGRSGFVKFESDAIPAGIAGWIDGALATATEPEDVEAIFARASMAVEGSD